MHWLLRQWWVQLAIPWWSWLLLLSPVSADAADPLAYPQSVDVEIKSLLAAGAQESSDPVFLITLAELYLDAGDDLYTKESARRRAYAEGAKIALRVVELQDTNAEAHYLYAANLGSAARLKGIMASALTVGTLRTHTARALELDPNHPQALHMMGKLLNELPEIFGGDPEQALLYLQRAVEVDPSYTHARLNLAKAYLTRDRRHEARRELQTILQTDPARSPYALAQRHRPEAQSLLESLRSDQR